VLTELAVLGAPVAALVAVAPFERLRQALAPSAPEPGARVVRGRARSLAGDATGARPGATPASAGRAARTAPLRDPGVPTLRHAVAPRHASEERPGYAPARPEIPSSVTLAQRRATARRTATAAGMPSSPSFTGVPPSATGAPRSSAPPPLPEAPVASDRESGTGAESATTPMIARSSLLRRLVDVPHHDRPRASGALASAEASIGRELGRAAGAIDARVELAPGNEAGVELGRDGAPRSASAPMSGAVTPSPARGASLPAAGDSTSPGRAKSRPGAEVARSPRSPDRGGGFELADDLFESLYREGVDLSWP
jgi:hypothetical protein